MHPLRYVISSFIALLLLAGCAPPPAGSIQPDPGGDGPIIPETTKVISQETSEELEQISEDGSTFTFSTSTDQLEALAPGDVMVSGPTDAAPNGYLRRVVSVRNENGQVIVETEQATLEEAVQQGSLEMQMPLGADDISSIDAPPGVHMKPVGDASSRAIELTFDEVVYQNATGSHRVILDGSVEIQPTFDLDMKIRDSTLQEFDLSSTVTEASHLNMTVSAGTDTVFQDGFSVEVPVTLFALNTMVGFIGPVPVVITPWMNLVIGADGTIRTEMYTSLSQQAQFTAGVTYANGRWDTQSDFSNNYDFTPPVFQTSTEIGVFVGPKLMLRFYGVAGPYLLPSLYMRGESSDGPSYRGSVYAGMNVSIGISADVISVTLVDRDLQIFDTRFLEYTVEGPTVTPTDQPTPTPTMTPTLSAPTSTPPPPADAIVGPDGVNMRIGPDEDYQVMHFLDPGEPLDIVEVSADHLWAWIITDHGGHGWVYVPNLIVYIDLNSVPVSVVTLQAPGGDTPPEPRLGTGEVQITLRWTGWADLDLHVIDPGGTEIFYANQTSPSGGRLDVDANANCATREASVENVFWPDGGAPSGQYRVKVIYYGDCGDAGTVSWEVTVRIDRSVYATRSGTISEGQTVDVISFNH